MSPCVKAQKTILVVGTTPDYIEWIRRIAPGRALFLTDRQLRRQAKEPRPGPEEEILCDLADDPQAASCLAEHLGRWGIELGGIACFDCESMDLAAELAGRYALAYPSREAVGLCRDKYRSKLKWRERGLHCPRAERIHSPDEAARFQAELGAPAVLKPLTGSGSEHVWLCRSAEECRIRYGSIAAALESRRSNRLYRPPSTAAPDGLLVVAEEFIDGREYSCDFIIDNGRIEPIRLTRKIPARNRPFGTIHGYWLCHDLPPGIGGGGFGETLRECASSLGVERGICMLDFMVREGEMVLLEMAPRPGGDCLPPLLRRARGLDILKLSLDFAGQEEMVPADPFLPAFSGYMGIRIIARQGGTLGAIDTDGLRGDPRVLEIGLSKEPGHRIILPPEDYDSWILGHIVARVDPEADPAEALVELDGKIRIRMDGH